MPSKQTVFGSIACVALGGHILWVMLLGIMAWRGFGKFVPHSTSDAAADRLDIVATSLAIVGVGLTILGIVVAVAALTGFFAVKKEAVAAAEEEAKRETCKLIPIHLSEHLSSKPEILQAMVTIAIRANPDLIRQAAGVDSDVENAGDYSTIPVEEPPRQDAGS